jgi:ADP-ribosylglycohydrolase
MNDRRRGTLIGLAVGDGLGAAVEFKSPGGIAPVTCHRNGGPHRLKAGEWSDDTSMAVALDVGRAVLHPDMRSDGEPCWKPGLASVRDSLLLVVHCSPQASLLVV